MPTPRIIHADCLDALRELPNESVQAVITDPPYGLANTDSPHVVETLSRWFAGERDYLPAGAGFMGKAWDAFVPPPAVWDECYRVLKPGGHLLAFAGTRTVDLMGLSIRLAGFDIRDSITWLYGSGFPKSLDVSKAIDKAANTAGSWERQDHPGRPGKRTNPGTILGQGNHMREDNPDGLRHVYVPGSAGSEWAGWGTALKPASEPIVVARKPLAASAVNVLATVESSLYEQGVTGEIRWTNGPASGAARLTTPRTSSSTAQPRAAATSADPADASETPSDVQPTANASAPSTPHGEQPTPSTSATTGASKTASSAMPSSTPTAQPAPAATSESAPSSPSTTSTAEAPRTAARRGGRSTLKSDDSASLPVTASFAGTVTGLTGSRATVRINRLADGTFVWPDSLPMSVPGGPLTVAANVLAHGTGALNIAATRVGSDDGRWPANVVLDEHAAAALDEDSGHLKQGGAIAPGGKGAGARRNEVYGTDTADRGAWAPYEGSGGASRFFPVFKYQAKAPTRERPKVDGVAHPTVKPLDLMRWLVRLVTPPGGTVLEPFAGSGTTVEAALLEGMDVIAVERDADYLPLIQQRIDRVTAAPEQAEPEPEGLW